MTTTLERLLSRKNIGAFAGFCFIINSLSGPAVPITPSNFQSPGWLFTIISYVIFTFISGMNNLFLIESMQAIPGNKYFQGHVEFSTLINFYFGPNSHLFGQVILYCALQSNAIQSINLTAQATDRLILDGFGKTCGLSMSLDWICIVEDVVGSASPFGSTFMVFTFGWLTTLVFAIPFAFYDLDSSIGLTIASFVLTCLIAIQWVSSSIFAGLNPKRMPMTTPLGITYGQTMGTIMMNLACATVVPSWINIKAKEVNTQSIMWISISATAFFYVTIGVFFALGFDIDSSNNIFVSLLEFGEPKILCKISVAIFAYFMLLPAVPVNFLVSYSNLIQNDICGPKLGTFLAFVLPCLICIPLQTGQLLQHFLLWTSLTFVACANFIFPLVLYLKCVKFREDFNRNRVITLHQMKLLTKIHIDSVEINDYIGNKERENLLLESHGSNLNITPSIVLTPPVNSDASNLEYNRYSHELNHECITPGKGLPEEIVQYFEKQKNHPQKLSEYSKISLIIDRKLTRFPSLESIFDMDKPSPSEQTKGNFLAVPNDGGGESLSSSNSKILSQSDQLSTLSIDDFAKLTLRKEKKPHLYPVINKLTYINPSEVGIAGNWFEDDVPDPEMSFDEPDHTDTIPMIVASGGRTGRRPSDSSMESKGSLQHSEGSLPLERLFKSKPFRAVPTWVPVKPKYVAFCLLILTTTISIGNIVLNLPIYEEKVL